MPEEAHKKDIASFSAEDLSCLERATSLTYLETVNDFLVFGFPDRNGFRQRGAGIPFDVAVELLQAVNREAERMTDYQGWVDPEKGFVEFELRQQAMNPFRRGAADQFEFEIYPCQHSHASNPPFEYDEDRDRYSPVMRVTSSEGSTCLEISPNTALCYPLLPPTIDGEYRVRSQSTLKIYLEGATEKGELLRKARELANSFLFELSARHRMVYSLRPRVESPAYRRHGSTISNRVRFPRTPVPDNIATLFSIPGDTALRGNHTLFYLSYYQILEHYLPAVHRRETVRKVRRILRAIDFDEEKDSSVLQILNSVERSHGASEGEQLKALIGECVPEDKLREFFARDHDGHFEKNGPISGVQAINLKSGEALPSQVAKRIYMLRNRIVHAKDDVRYAESKVLLPLSYEALRLSPDIELLRLLAIEVVVDNR
ncbi:hypothetical protein [Streptomyces yerevanensis]|uniref:hypothetical protein n=1 Tax=Streptomyces yerevanensis TaxID=66378 RepID=UPI0012FF23AB|nr:hypothetical protein [Streptomyces yerevanensis]